MFQKDQQQNSPINDFWVNMPFTRLFRCFGPSVHFPRMFLALIGVILIFLVGSIMDWLTPRGSRVVVANFAQMGASNELQAFTEGQFQDPILGLQAFCDRAKRQNENTLIDIAQYIDGINASEVREHLSKGDTDNWLEKIYEASLEDILPKLEKRYKTRQRNINADYDAVLELEGKKLQRDQELADAKKAYLRIFAKLVNPQTEPDISIDALARKLIVADSQLKDQDRLDDETNVSDIRKKARETYQLASAYRIAKDIHGQGIFTTLMRFNARRFHRVVVALVGQLSPREAGRQASLALSSMWWLVRYHWLYAIVFGLAFLAIWSVIGGAICRMAALQIARDEQIGPIRAIQFSLARFTSFFSAPLIPVAVILLIGLVTCAVSLLGAIPVIGEILMGIMLGLALLGGFVIALVLIGLVGGINLMFPAVAVEGCEAFDAISRPYSYVLAKPWHLGFYAGVAAVYGGICYLFVRLFVFLMLAAVHFFVGLAVNIDGSANLDIIGKLNALWQQPTFNNLVPDINWTALGGAESLAAALVWCWVALAAVAILAFVMSFFCTAGTTIYFLLRQQVDATDIEDIYVDPDAEELSTEQDSPQEQATDAQPESTGTEPDGQSKQASEDNTAPNQSQQDDTPPSDASTPEEPPASSDDKPQY